MQNLKKKATWIYSVSQNAWSIGPPMLWNVQHGGATVLRRKEDGHRILIAFGTEEKRYIKNDQIAKNNQFLIFF